MLSTFRSNAWPVRRDLKSNVSQEIIWHPVLASSMLATEVLRGESEGSCAQEALLKTRWNSSLQMHGGQAKSNRGILTHAADVTGFLVLCDPRPYLTPTSLKRFMKRGPKRQGLWRWHCRELTVIWVARCEATATMNTASYIKAASVCGGGSQRKMFFSHTAIKSPCVVHN